MYILPVVGRKKEAEMFWSALQDSGVREDYSNPQAVVVMGGDGTFLHAQRTHYHLGRPFVGVGFGTVNFLLNRTLTDPEYFVKRMRQNQWLQFPAHGIDAQMTTDDGVHSGVAFNDVFIKAMNPAGVVGIEITTAEYRNLVVEGDGVIVASPQGSTAYNRNAGGTILPLGSALWGLTSICAKKRVHVTIQQQQMRMRITRGQALAVIDNEIVPNVHEVVLSPSVHTTEILFDPAEDFERRRYNEV